MIYWKNNSCLETGITGWAHSPENCIGCEYSVNENNQTDSIHFFTEGQEEELEKKIESYKIKG